MQSPSGISLMCFVLVGSILLFEMINHPIPKGFSQPWKYRFLSYGAYRIDQLGSYCEKFGLFKRVDLIRNLHYVCLGLFQKRLDECRLKVTDRKIVDIPVRIYQPKESIDSNDQTAMIYFHGGGFVLGSIETYDQSVYLLANLTRIIIISVEYRLAPEHRFPSAFDDCFSVSREIFINAQKYRINPKRILLSGDSAGGNLALAVTQKLVDLHLNPFLVSLLYPSLQFVDFTLPSYNLYFPLNILGVLNEQNLLTMIDFLIGNNSTDNKEILMNNHISNDAKKIYSSFLDPQRFLSISHRINSTEEENFHLIEQFQFLTSPSMSPLLVEDEKLNRLPPILLFTTEFDILRDEGFIFAARLRSLNKNIYHHHFHEGFHGAHVFLYGPLSFDIAHRMIEHTAETIRKYLSD